MTLTTPFKRGFSCYPFMFIPKRIEKETAEYSSYVSHETVHYLRQSDDVPFFGTMWAIGWIVKYFWSKEFRWEEEKLAYTAEIGCLKTKGRLINEQYYINTLMNEYWNMCSREQAEVFVRSLRG